MQNNNVTNMTIKYQLESYFATYCSTSDPQLDGQSLKMYTKICLMAFFVTSCQLKFYVSICINKESHVCWQH